MPRPQPPAPIAQRTERRFPKPCVQVQFLVGALLVVLRVMLDGTASPDPLPRVSTANLHGLVISKSRTGAPGQPFPWILSDVIVQFVRSQLGDQKGACRRLA